MSHGIQEHDSLFSVREMPWHGKGVVLDEYPDSLEEALTASGLGWRVNQGDLFYVKGGEVDPTEADPEKGLFVPQLEASVARASNYRANLRVDTGEILGIVGDDYKVVQNLEAFRWLEALLGGDLKWETAGSLNNGRRVWVLVTPGDQVEVGGDPTQLYIYCSNSHDGSQAVVAAATKVRIVCANTLGWAENLAATCPRTYRFRHTGDMQVKLDEAREVMGIVLNWDAAFKRMGDELAREPITERRFDTKVVQPFLGMDDPTLADRKIALRNREDNREIILSLFKGEGPQGDTSGNSPGTKWCAANAIAEFCDWNRRYAMNTDQIQRSFEDQSRKQHGLDLVVAA